jgi:hypothetical protein
MLMIDMPNVALSGFRGFRCGLLDLHLCIWQPVTVHFVGYILTMMRAIVHLISWVTTWHATHTPAYMG